MSLCLLRSRIANWIEGDFELNSENLKKSRRWGEVKSDVEPAGNQDYLGKVTSKKRRDLLWEMSDHRMRSQRQGKGKIATAVFWRGWGSKCQSWGDQKKTSLCALLALGMAPSVCESHWQDLNFLLSPSTRALAIYYCHQLLRQLSCQSQRSVQWFQCFQHCWFWETANAKIPKICWWNLSILLYFH